MPSGLQKLQKIIYLLSKNVKGEMKENISAFLGNIKAIIRQYYGNWIAVILPYYFLLFPFNNSY